MLHLAAYSYSRPIYQCNYFVFVVDLAKASNEDKLVICRKYYLGKSVCVGLVPSMMIQIIYSGVYFIVLVPSWMGYVQHEHFGLSDSGWTILGVAWTKKWWLASLCLYSWYSPSFSWICIFTISVACERLLVLQVCIQSTWLSRTEENTLV